MMMAERDYAHRDVVDKLGIKPGGAVAFALEAREIDAELRERILLKTGCPPAEDNEAVDVVMAFIDHTLPPAEVLKRWKQCLKPTGGIWLLTAKRGQPGYVDQRELIEAGREAGVVDNKVCSLSATVSAMRFVIRKRDRVDFQSGQV
jgi:hypothetical protein